MTDYEFNYTQNILIIIFFAKLVWEILAPCYSWGTADLVMSERARECAYELRVCKHVNAHEKMKIVMLEFIYSAYFQILTLIGSLDLIT